MSWWHMCGASSLKWRSGGGAHCSTPAQKFAADACCQLQASIWYRPRVSRRRRRTDMITASPFYHLPILPFPPCPPCSTDMIAGSPRH